MSKSIETTSSLNKTALSAFIDKVIPNVSSLIEEGIRELAKWVKKSIMRSYSKNV